MEEEKPKHKGGRRQKKKREIKNAPVVHHTPLKRNIPVYDVINGGQVERVHCASPTGVALRDNFDIRLPCMQMRGK